MRINYKKLIKNIPNQVRVKAKRLYEVLFSDNIKDNADVLGETRFDPKQIVLKSAQGNKELIYTYYHEFLHAVSEEYGAELTESQVRSLEKSFPYMNEFFLTINGYKK